MKTAKQRKQTEMLHWIFCILFALGTVSLNAGPEQCPEGHVLLTFYVLGPNEEGGGVTAYVDGKPFPAMPWTTQELGGADCSKRRVLQGEFETICVEVDKPFTVEIHGEEIEAWHAENYEWVDHNKNCIIDPDNGELEQGLGWDAARGYAGGELVFVGCTKPELIEGSLSDGNEVNYGGGRLSYNGIESEAFLNPEEAEDFAMGEVTSSSSGSADFIAKSCFDEANGAGEKGQENGSCPCESYGSWGEGASVGGEGGSNPQLNELFSSMPYGVGTNGGGQGIGVFNFQGKLSDPNRVDGENLTFLQYLPEIEYDQVLSGADLRQLKTPNNLFDLVQLANALELRTYLADANLEPGAGGLYPVDPNSLISVQRIESVEKDGVPGIQYTTETADGSVVAIEAVYGENDGARSWRRHERDDGTVVETETILFEVDMSNPNAPSWTRTVETIRLVIDESGTEQAVSHEMRVYRRETWAVKEVLSQVIEDPDGSAQVTSFTYHDDPGEPDLLGKEDYVIHSDGVWTRNIYDADGRIEGTLSPWMDGPSDPALATIENSRYQTVDGEYLLGKQAIRRVSSERVANDPWDGEQSYHVKTEEYVGLSPYPESVEESWYELGDNDVFRGRLKRRVAGDGTMVSFPDENTTIHGTRDNPDGIPFRTVKIQTIEHTTNTYVYVGGGYELLTTSSNHYDEEGRLAYVEQDGNVVYERIYGPDGDVTTVDEFGVEWRLEEDGVRRVLVGIEGGNWWQAQPDVTIESIPEGDNVREVVSAGSLSVEVVSGPGIQIDQTGAVTTTVETNFGRTVTETGPGGLDIVTEYYLDGQLKSVAGEGVVDEYYSYEVLANGFVEETVRFGSEMSSRYQKSITAGGRLRSVRYPGSNSEYVETLDYNLEALRRRRFRTGLATVITEERPGGLVRHGLDLDADGRLEVHSEDRIREIEEFYEKQNGRWYKVTVERAYLFDDSRATQVKRIEESVGGGDKMVRTLLVGEGVEVVETTIDRAAKRVEVKTVREGADLEIVDTYVNGLLVARASSAGQSPALYRYDALRRLVETQTPMSSASFRKEYNPEGQVVSEIDPNGAVTLYDYYPNDHVSAGMLRSEEDSVGRKKSYAYNPSGLLEYQWGGVYPQRFVYDEYGDMIELHSYRDGDEQAWAQEELPQAFSTVASTVRRWHYHPASGLLVGKEYSDGSMEEYSYHPSRLIHEHDSARGVTTSYSYGIAGDVIAIDYSDGTEGVRFFYYRDGNVSAVEEGVGRKEFFYSLEGTMEGYAYVTGTLAGLGVTVKKDGQGRKASVAPVSGDGASLNTQYFYDGQSRLSSVESAGSVFEFSYGQNASLVEGISMKKGGEAILGVVRSYRANGSPESVGFFDGQGLQLAMRSYGYDNSGQRTSIEIEDGRKWCYGYNQRRELIDSWLEIPGGTILEGSNSSFRYDASGNRVERIRRFEGEEWVTEYSSNGLDQYLEIETPGELLIRGAVEDGATVVVNGLESSQQGAGYWYANLSANNESSAVYMDIEVNSQLGPDLNSLSGAVFLPPRNFEPSYDGDGNLVEDGRWIYSWDGANRLSTVETSPSAASSGAPRIRLEYLYDSEGRQVVRTKREWSNGEWQEIESERYVYDGWNRVASYAENGALKKGMVYGGDFRGVTGSRLSGAELRLMTLRRVGEEGYDTVYHGLDAQGSSVLMLGGGDSIEPRAVAFEPFGEVFATSELSSELDLALYSLQEADPDTGHYNFGKRYFDPVNGRWLGRDPIGEEGGANLYSYVRNRPSDLIDLFGEEPINTLPGPESLIGEYPKKPQGCPSPSSPKMPKTVPKTPSLGPVSKLLPQLVIADLILGNSPPFHWTVPTGDVLVYGDLHPKTQSEYKVEIQVQVRDWTDKGTDRRPRPRLKRCCPLALNQGVVFYGPLRSGRGSSVSGAIRQKWHEGKAFASGKNNPLWWSSLPSCNTWRKGHLLGKALGGHGNTRWENMVPQTYDANHRKIRRFERLIEDWYRNQRTICFAYIVDDSPLHSPIAGPYHRIPETTFYYAWTDRDSDLPRSAILTQRFDGSKYDANIVGPGLFR